MTPISPVTWEIDANIAVIVNNRQAGATKDLRDWLKKVNLPYHSPHKFRHGHAVYGITNAKDVSDLKAISQNLMHSNLSITDGVYGILSENDVKGKISLLGQSASSRDDKNINDLIFLTRQLLEKLELSQSSSDMSA